MKIIPLSEGSFTIDKTKVFVPFDEEKHNLQERSKGSLLVEVQPFVVITDNDILLLDAGLGFKNKNGVMQIHQNLMDNGINPSEVTKVLMSHLHKDHSGGISYKQESDGKVKLSFPSAKYFIQKKELELALSHPSSSYIKEELDCLENSTQVELIDGDGTIDNYIRYQVTSAHSQFHQVFWITQGNKTVFFGGDDAPQQQQMKSRYIAKYDYNGRKCMELRHEWWKKGKAEHWTFLFYHDIRTPFYPSPSEQPQ
jgi:glyoxylase-like metal-dependent hydrolase (beta-lactamase superfamily II)